MAKDYLKGSKGFKLAWMFTISTLDPVDELLVYVDAITGEIINSRSIIDKANTPLTAETLYSGTLTITGDSFGGGYRLRENRNGVTVQTLNLQNATTFGGAIDFTNSSTNWTTGNWSAIGTDQAALDAHWGAEMVLDYFSSAHSRNSINGSGMTVTSYVHYGSGVDNAYWFPGPGNRFMVYGDGSVLNPLTALDICAHEFGHGINEFTAALGQGSNGLQQSNALNEGFSDIWGACVEYSAAPGKQRWLIGEELFSSVYSCIRDMSNPNSSTAYEGQHPDTYLGTYWNSGGEPHYNSTVLSHWFYLLTEGGSGTNDNSNAFDVTGIGITDAASIVYRALTTYLTSTSNYSNARTAMIQAAKDLFGAGSCEEISVTNAWYAVGVGSQYSTIGISVQGDAAVCTTSGNYTITNLPSGSTVVWSASPSGAVTINSPTSTSTTLTKTGDNTITLTATITTPCGIVTASKSSIVVGSPYFSKSINGAAIVYPTAMYNYTLTVPFGKTISNIVWTVPSGWTLNLGQGTGTITITTGTSGGDVECDFDDECGTTWQTYINAEIGTGGPDPLRIGVSPTKLLVGSYPNPATTDVTISLITDNAKEKKMIKEILITDKLGNVKRNLKFSGTNSVERINVAGLAPDIYIAKIYTGTEWISCKVVVAR